MHEWYLKHRDEHLERVAERKRRVRTENRKAVLTYLLAHPCVDCGERDPDVLDFDHVRGEKRSEVTDLAFHNSLNWAAVEVEIAKCEVRCANCHRRKTRKSLGWYSYGAGQAALVQTEP